MPYISPTKLFCNDHTLCLTFSVKCFIIFNTPASFKVMWASWCTSRCIAWSVSDNWLSCCAFYILSKLVQLCHTVKHVAVYCLCMSCRML